MKLTNNFGMPETILNVIARPQYSKGKANMSVTELLNSPRIVQLKRKHWDDLTEDASDMVWSIFGTAIHNVLEHGKGDNHVVEERIHVELNGMRISGAIDLQEMTSDGVIVSDYKTTSAWAVMNEKQDWHNQLNSYAYLVEAAKKLPVCQALAVVICVAPEPKVNTTLRPPPLVQSQLPSVIRPPARVMVLYSHTLDAVMVYSLT